MDNLRVIHNLLITGQPPDVILLMADIKKMPKDLEVKIIMPIFATDIFTQPLNIMRMKRKKAKKSAKSCSVSKLLITLQP